MQLKDYIRLEQAKAIHSNIKLVITGMVGVTLVMTIMFWSDELRIRLLLWIGAAIAIIWLRVFIGRRFNSTLADVVETQRWLRLSLFGSFLTGLHWAVVPLLFLSDEAGLLTLFVTIIYAGHLSGSMSSNSAYPPAYYTLAIPTTVLFAGFFVYVGGAFHNSIAVMIGLFFYLTSFLTKNAALLFREARELNFKNMELMKQLQIQKDAAENATLAKSRFLAAASHDLRQPLHSTGLLFSALERHVSSEEGKGLLKDIHLANEALNHSFSSLLDVSKLDAGVVRAYMQHICLGDLLMPIFRKHQIEAEQKGLEFIFDGEPIAVYSDVVLLERVLNNLISNAIHYTNLGSVEVVWSKVNDGRVKLLVKDTGIGIETDQIDKVFSEYYQINNPERDREKGFGLGLAIVKRLCKILSIQIYVCSDVNSATIFAIYLKPGDISKVEQRQNSPIAISSLCDFRILVVDDDASVRRSMEKLISSWDAEVYSADSARDAVATVVNIEDSIDLIIADYRLRNKKTGVEAIQLIREELNHDVPAMIITGDTSPDRLRQITSAGFVVLHKPVSAAILRSAIQQKLRSGH